MDNDNPTLGVVLCTETDEDIARYSVLHDNDQLFASKYKLYLPTEEELRAEIVTQKRSFICRKEKTASYSFDSHRRRELYRRDCRLRRSPKLIMKEDRHERRVNSRGDAANVTVSQ